MASPQPQASLDLKDIGKPLPTVNELLERIAFILRNAGTDGACRGEDCDAVIVFVTHTNGRPMPYNADGTPHWATCPNAKSFKRR